MDRFMRTELLLGKPAMERLSRAHVSVFGLGGVGSYIAEALARSGIGTLTLIDKDVVDITNINRQIPALSDTVGQLKVTVMAKRIQAINPHCIVFEKPLFFREDTIPDVFSDTPDFIADAIDTISAKILLVLEATKRGIPIISSMGAANKLDPSQFRILDIMQTTVDPIAKIMRKELKRQGFTGSLPVVSSTETPRVPIHAYQMDESVTEQANKPRKAIIPPASIAFVPPVAGLLLASHIVRTIAEAH